MNTNDNIKKTKLVQSIIKEIEELETFLLTYVNGTPVNDSAQIGFGIPMKKQTSVTTDEEGNLIYDDPLSRPQKSTMGIMSYLQELYAKPVTQPSIPGVVVTIPHELMYRIACNILRVRKDDLAVLTSNFHPTKENA